MANAWIITFLSGSTDCEVVPTEVLHVEGMSLRRCDLAFEDGGT